MVTAFVRGRIFVGDGKVFEQGTSWWRPIRLVMQGGKLVKGEW